MSKDLLIEKILSYLPGVDCGGCEAGTCTACAEAMAEAKDPTMCPAIKQVIVKKIAKAMKVAVPEIEEMVAFLACAGCAAGKKRFAEGFSSCQDAVNSGFHRHECKDGCVGLGSCIEVCKFDAMSLEDGQLVIDREKCTGCGVCARELVCPQNIIRMIPAEASNLIPCSSTVEEEDDVKALCKFGCIGCGECERVCPQEAVHIVNNHAVIDYDECVGCDACTIRCKKKIVIDTLHDLTQLKEKVAFVHCKGGAKAKEVFEAKGITRCDEAAKLNKKRLGLCSTGCLGLGKCEATCRYGAIKIVDGTAVVDQQKCVGCRDCTIACPMGIISIVPYGGMKQVACSSVDEFDDFMDKDEICTQSCVGCGDCVDNCPNGAIYIEGNHAEIDPNICEDCNMCQYVCARNVIAEIKVPEFIFDQKYVMEVTKGEQVR